jgi:hypothetical protein
VEKILSMPSFGGEVKPSVPCRSFAACKRYLNGLENASFGQNYQTPFSPTVPTFGTWSARVVGESKGKLPLRIYPERSMPEPYLSPDWALVPAKTGPRAEYCTRTLEMSPFHSDNIGGDGDSEGNTTRKTPPITIT